MATMAIHLQHKRLIRSWYHARPSLLYLGHGVLCYIGVRVFTCRPTSQLNVCLLAMLTSTTVVRCVLYIVVVSNRFEVLTVNTVSFTMVCVCTVNVQVWLHSICFRFSVTEFLSVWMVYCCILWAPNFYVVLAEMTACTMQSSLGRMYIVHI